ncbi:MAG: carotenoid 1,2-hydratase [Chloroflexi bacterium]|nr:carotenoid 1,2-hydratase [Chloroflexota bacterium]
MKRIAALLGLLLVAGMTVLILRAPSPSGVSAEVTALQHVDDAAGYLRAIAPRALVFPADHGPHPDYQTEWWYYTGNLTATDGRRFGYQLTFFRRAITPTMQTRDSDWATNQVYFAHFALTDGSSQRHIATERYSRGAAGLAGASGAPYRLWLENWSVESLNADGSAVRLRASDTPAGTGELALDLKLESTKPLALHGENGLSRKSALAGNASYYFSYTRLASLGSLTINSQRFDVSGQSWMDHEFGTTGLGSDAVGWDWFSLQLNDGRELMVFQIRRRDGSIEPFSSGTLIMKDGTTHFFPSEQFRVQVLDHWQSPRTGGRYPSRWTLELPSERITLNIAPLVADQEMDITFKYWEGAVRISGQSNGATVDGYGYVEMTGYAGQFPR